MQVWSLPRLLVLAYPVTWDSIDIHIGLWFWVAVNLSVFQPFFVTHIVPNMLPPSVWCMQSNNCGHEA